LFAPFLPSITEAILWKLRRITTRRSASGFLLPVSGP
jgi:hypothetical protein